MEYVYAALLLHRTSREINEENLKKVIEATGKEADEAKIKTLIASLKGIDIEKELETATLATVAPVSSAVGETKEEKKEEKAEEAAEGLSALFG